MQPLLLLFGAEAAALLWSAVVARGQPGSVVRRRVSCRIAARPATIDVALPISPGAPATLVRCPLLEAGVVRRCDRACLADAQPVRRAPSRPQLLRVEVLS